MSHPSGLFTYTGMGIGADLGMGSCPENGYGSHWGSRSGRDPHNCSVNNFFMLQCSHLGKSPDRDPNEPAFVSFM